MNNFRKNYFIFAICVLGLTFINFGCGSSSSTTTTTTSNTTTTQATGGTISISGRLTAGSVRASAINLSVGGLRSLAIETHALADCNDYNVVAVGTVDNKIYFPDARTDASGTFTFSNLPSDESFYLDIINNENKFVAPISFAATNDAVVMAITPEAGTTLELGSIIYESAKGAAVPSLEVTSRVLDTTSTAKHETGETLIPVGTGLNLGRGTGEAYYSGTPIDKVDEDNDGLPDIIDVDDNGNGKVDGLDSSPRLATRVEVSITGVNNTNAFSNLAKNYEDYPTYISGTVNSTPVNLATSTVMAIEVVMPTGTAPTTFSDIRIVEGPAWLDTATISMADSTRWENYPTTSSLWKNDNNKLYKGIYSGADRWSVWVIPNGTPEAGDTLKFRVTHSGTEEYLLSTITYVFSDLPRLVGYSYLSGATLVTKEAADLNLDKYNAGQGGISRVFTYEGTSITFMWTNPKNESGTYLSSVEGINSYLDGIVNFNSSGSTISNNPSFLITPTPISHATFGTINSYTFTPTTEAAMSYFKVDIKAQSAASGGGNASQMIQFKKQ